MEWKRLTTREADEKEREDGYDFMWVGETPELFEEVLVSDGKSVWTDTWTEFDIGQGFENNDGECWWMPFPEPPRKENNND